MGIRYRTDRSKWEVSYTDSAGKRQRPQFATKEDAEEFQRKLSGVEQANGKSNLKATIHKYVSVFTARKSKRNDERHYFEVFFDYIQDHNVANVEQIKLEHLQMFQTHLLSVKKLATTSVNRYFNTYRHFFNACIDWGYIKESPAARLKDFPESRKKVGRKLWSDEQIDAALAKANGWLKQFIYLVAYTGMRPIEVCRMTWAEHVDLKANKVLAVTYKGSGERVERWLPVTDEMMLELKKRKLSSGSKFVFTSSRGVPLTSQVVARALRESVTSKLGMSGLTMYGMRHSFATRTLESAVDLEQLRMLMGHSNLNTTQVYLQYTDGHMKDAMMKSVASRKIGEKLGATNLPPSCHQAASKKL